MKSMKKCNGVSAEMVEKMRPLIEKNLHNILNAIEGLEQAIKDEIDTNDGITHKSKSILGKMISCTEEMRLELYSIARNAKNVVKSP